MANHSSTKKAIRKTISKTAINKNQKTRIKTYIKRVLTSIKSGSSEDANKAFIEAQSEIMKGVANKLIKKNTGARKVSRLATKVKSIAGQKAEDTKPVSKAAVKPKLAKEVKNKDISKTQ